MVGMVIGAGIAIVLIAILIFFILRRIQLRSMCSPRTSHTVDLCTECYLLLVMSCISQTWKHRRLPNTDFARGTKWCSMGERSCVKWVCRSARLWINEKQSFKAAVLSSLPVSSFRWFLTGLSVYLFPGGYVLLLPATPEKEAEDAQHCQKVRQRISCNSSEKKQILVWSDANIQWPETRDHSLSPCFSCLAGSFALRRKCPRCRPRSRLPQCWRQISLSSMWPTLTFPRRCFTCWKMFGRFWFLLTSA